MESSRPLDKITANIQWTKATKELNPVLFLRWTNTLVRNMDVTLKRRKASIERVQTHRRCKLWQIIRDPNKMFLLTTSIQNKSKLFRQPWLRYKKQRCWGLWLKMKNLSKRGLYSRRKFTKWRTWWKSSPNHWRTTTLRHSKIWRKKNGWVLLRLSRLKQV